MQITCEFCEEKFTTKTNRTNERKQRFCSKSCASRAIIRTKGRKHSPEAIAKMVAARKRWYATEAGLLHRSQSSKRMMENNPGSRPEVITKMITTKRDRGILHIWKGERGGNGKLTPQQRLLKEKLGGAWEPELPIKTQKKRGNGYPTSYKVDLGNTSLMIAIEIDGKGHRIKKKKLLDIKKEELLVSLGWCVLRFTNDQITTNLTETIKTIKRFIASR
jgi:hypothetical protein